jgi:predicted hydrocarbon binding protein
MTKAPMPMFDIRKYPYNEERNCIVIGGEAMIFHCHHYLNYLQRSILDADYIDSRPFIIGSAADAAFYQLTDLCRGLSINEAKQMVADVYKTFGYGLINIKGMTPSGGRFETYKSFYSKTWRMKFGSSKRPVDYFTTGFIAAAYAVIYGLPLDQIFAEQLSCMACGDDRNVHVVRAKECNFSVYPPKNPLKFNNTPKLPINWEHEETVTRSFLGAHENMVGNEEGYIPAFGVYITRNLSDFINRLQFEFVRAMQDVGGEYGEQLASELLLEAGHACGFFTYGGVMTSDEWNLMVKPYLHTPEDWIKGLASLINTMGWGYHTIVEVSRERAIFRNYNDFEDLSYMRMYGVAEKPVHWANSGGFTGLMQLIYNTDLINGEVIDTEEGFRNMRRSKAKYKTRMLKSIACGDNYLEAEIST